MRPLLTAVILIFCIHTEKIFSQCNYSIGTTVTPISCYGGSNGAIFASVNGDTADISNPGVLISEIFTDPAGNDSPFEWVELVATKSIDFSLTPYTVITSNNGFATSKGWMQSGAPTPPPNNATYAFLIDSGSVSPGDVFYIGGINMAVSGMKLRVKNTGTEGGDGGIGAPFMSTGVIGNGGGVADGVAVFNRPVHLLDSSSIPVDAIFFGTGIGSTATVDTSKGFTLPVNDNYSGGHLKINSFCAPDVLGKFSVKASGRYHCNFGTYLTTRLWSAMSVAGPTGVSDIHIDELTYNWSNGATSKSIQNLSAGTYVLTITNKGLNACVQQSSFTVNFNGSPVSISMGGNPPACQNASNGSMYAYVSGLNYHSLFYTWSNGESGYYKNQISDLAPGTYSVTVSDGQSSCNYSQSFTLTDNKDYPVTTASSNNTLCPGDSNGYIQSQLIQPYFPPHSYLWSNGETGSSISQVPAGIYTVTVTDRFGCTYSDTAIVHEELEVVIDSVSPETSTAGYPVTLSGHGFGRISEVYFNSLRAPLITSISDSLLTVIVPENADTGNISIKTKNNCLVEGPYFNPTDKYGKLTVKVFYEGIYINGGYLNSPLINSGISGDALSTDLIQIELISASDLNRILSSSICTLNTRGVTEVKFSYDLIGENVWIRIKGRNVMETWSKTPVILDEFCSFDFTTEGALQGVATLSIDSIQYTAALARIKIINPITDSIITMGVCWGIGSDPIIEIDQINFISWNGDTLPFSIGINQLQPGYKYFARAFISTSKGVFYGNTINFTTPFILMDNDGNIYDTVRIGNQTWMKQNLAVSQYRNGNIIPNINSYTNWNYAYSYQRGAWTYYDTLPSYNHPYGKLYNGYAVNDTAICPSGWHIPSSGEWHELISYLGGSNVAGGALRDTLLWNSPNAGASNSSGFSALPGGFRYYWGGFDQIGNRAYFRSSDGPSLVIQYNVPYVWFEQDPSRGESIRCVKDRLPEVTTDDLINRSSNRLFVGGNIGYVDGAPNFSRGICWSTTPQPNISLHTKIFSGTGSGPFKVSIPNLSPVTTYYYRAFSTDGNVVVYGEIKQAQTAGAALPGQIVDIDGFAYDTVVIGSQTWLKQNLRTFRYLNGVAIPENNNSWYYLPGGVLAYYNGNPSYDTIYGKLYNLYAINDTLICPAGFHVPTSQEFSTLINYLGGPYQAVNKLKESGTTFWLSTSPDVNNQSGFTALPGGIRNNTTSSNLGEQAVFGGLNSKMEIGTSNSPVYLSTFNPHEGASIRCIKDALPELSSTTLEGINSSRVFATGSVTYDGGAPLTGKGFCLSTSPLPTLYSNHVVSDSNLTNFSINNEIRNLMPGTTYFIRAYATNTIGTNYGNEISFTTKPIGSNQVADIDGNLYSTMPWGNHRLFRTNLRVSRYNNEESLGKFSNNNEAYNLGFNQKGAYFSYNANNTNYYLNDSLEGKFYNWYAINDTNLCPAGWHLPSRKEWNSNSGNAMNSFLYQGYYNNNPYGYQYNLGNTPYYYWIKEESYGDYAPVIGGGSFYKSFGMTARCFNDTTPYQYSLLDYRNKQPGHIAVSARVNLDGGVPITSKGICWSTTPNPTINNQSISVGSDTGLFEADISGLNHNTLYYIRPHATNSIGTSYGPEVSIKTLITGQVVDFEGNGYDTVHIGNRIWLKQNLRTRFYRNGQPISQVQSNTAWANIPANFGAWAYYNNDSLLASTNGLLYNWYAVNDTAICPVGFRVPGDSDWNELILALDPTACLTCQGVQSTTAGGVLKSNLPGAWNSPNTQANNSSGFTGIGAGSRNTNGQDSGLGLYGYWWSSSPLANGAWMRYVEYNSGSVNRNTNGWGVGYSVRCVNE